MMASYGIYLQRCREVFARFIYYTRCSEVCSRAIVSMLKSKYLWFFSYYQVDQDKYNGLLNISIIEYQGWMTCTSYYDDDQCFQCVSLFNL